MNNKGHGTIELQTMVVTDYYKERTMENIQKGGNNEVPDKLALLYK